MYLIRRWIHKRIFLDPHNSRPIRTLIKYFSPREYTLPNILAVVTKKKKLIKLHRCQDFLKIYQNINICLKTGYNLFYLFTLELSTTSTLHTLHVWVKEKSRKNPSSISKLPSFTSSLHKSSVITQKFPNRLFFFVLARLLLFLFFAAAR